MRALILALVLGWASHAGAVDLPQNRPNPDRAAVERSLEQQTQLPVAKVEGYTHLPDLKAGTLIQPQGREFRDVRTRIEPWVNAGLLVVAIASMLALYLFAGPMKYRPDPAGRTIKRFTVFERFIHWLTAATFIWLAFTGLNLVFGRALLRPLLGDDVFASLSALLKLSHNAMGFAFMSGLVVMAVQWFWRNLPSKLDIAWFKTAGGMFWEAHPPTQKFNAGQKMIYWIAVFGGGLISLTGVLLLFPFYLLDIGGMQITHGLHSTVAGLMVAVIIGHIYLGSVGVPGSFKAMSTGRVDLGWAKTHHGLWVEEQGIKGNVPPAAETPLHPAE